MRYSFYAPTPCLSAAALNRRTRQDKQSSDLYTERGIDRLARYIAKVEDKPYDPSHALIRRYPVTDPPLLPFAEHGKRYDDEQWSKLVHIAGVTL